MFRCVRAVQTAGVDPLDRQIAALLVEDARRSFGDIGARVGLSAPAVKRRVDRLEETGLVTGYSAVLGAAASAWPTEAFVELVCDDRTSPASILAAVGEHPEVVAAYTITGASDALLHLRAADTAHLEATLERLRASPTVVRTTTQIVLTRLLERPVPLQPDRAP